MSTSQESTPNVAIREAEKKFSETERNVVANFIQYLKQKMAVHKHSNNNEGKICDSYPIAPSIRVARWLEVTQRID
ncbi:hypothetical protein QR680_016103 [Steinernema hermaphroditum]|uniref:Uncharacterized protein n=1 Tax=Steinernema hermaphroditum TaxID=289476 RepID=A0AA39HB04_9BILA|nr:hypothetical protein QR680_016103 [Steinernema hermaphroditum]